MQQLINFEREGSRLSPDRTGQMSASRLTGLPHRAPQSTTSAAKPTIYDPQRQKVCLRHQRSAAVYHFRLNTSRRRINEFKFISASTLIEMEEVKEIAHCE